MIVLADPAANFSAGGVHNLVISNSIVADVNTFNDSIGGAVTSLPVLTPPLIEDIESWTVGSPGTVGFGWTVTSTSTASLANAGWHVEQDGVANSFGTGPLDDHTNGGMKYMFTETSSGVLGDQFDLISPCIDFGALAQPKMSFWYHMFGAQMGTLQVLVRTDTGDALVWSLSGQQQTAETDPWLQATVNLSGFPSTAQVVFRGIRGSGLAE
ncbi:MAG: hypothetical protein R3B93_16880 [Bacteroidia bacterium]